VTVDVMPLQDLGNGSRIYIALANKSYSYTGGTNGETSFKHIFRKMLPASNGAFVANLQTNQTQTFNASYTFTVSSVPSQMDNNFWNSDFEVIVWVQKSSSKEVWNATIAEEGTLGIEDGDSDEFGLIVYPNPADDNTVVMFDGQGNEDVVIDVYNSLGQVVLSENRNNLQGRQRIGLNTTDLESGMYMVRVRQGDKLASSQLMIAR
ncbi:MAG TPA: T9SS type A sorting domain-containing protein, partial [Taishania sp.]|nr:T9SS type A sorting domain-containing protein [Taishania sp.]